MSQSESIGFEVRELSLLIARYIEKMSNGGHIRGPQGFALGYLVHNRDKEIYQKDLEEKLSIRKPTASNLVDRMVEALDRDGKGNSDDDRSRATNRKYRKHFETRYF